jgi:microcompartment protein CcmK/EutM
MRLAEVVGVVTLNRCCPELRGKRFVLVRPYDLQATLGERKSDNPAVAAVDDLGAGQGDVIALAEGREAAMPMYPERVGIDGYCAAIVDEFEADAEALK